MLLIIIFIFVTNSFIKAKIISIFNTDLFSFRFYFDRKCFFIIFALIIINKIEYRVSLQFIFFIILGAIAIASGIITVTNKNPLVSAFGLIVQFFMLAGLYLTLNAQFVAVIQILVYAGAIMVLVVFVIMLLNLGNEQALKEKFNTRKLIAALFSLALVLQLTIIFSSRISNEKISNLTTYNSRIYESGSVSLIGDALFSDYLLPFEVVSLLLLVAIVGSVLLAKRKIE